MTTATLAPMPLRRLGGMDWDASRLTMGGVKWDDLCSETEAINLLQRALELGINTFDTAADYGAGESERRLGIALEGERDAVWICTKTSKRSKDGARRDIENSLKRLRTDRIDLLYIHALDDEEDLRHVLARDGCLPVLREYQEAGLIRHLGVSGHWFKDSMEKLIAEVPLDAVLVPAGLFNHAYDYSYLDRIIPAARARGMAVLGMKIFGAGRVKKARSIEPYLRYSLHLPVDSLVIGCDSIAQLEATISVIVSNPPPLDPSERDALLPEAKRITQSWDRGEFNWVSHYA